MAALEGSVERLMAILKMWSVVGEWGSRMEFMKDIVPGVLWPVKDILEDQS